MMNQIDELIRMAEDFERWGEICAIRAAQLIYLYRALRVEVCAALKCNRAEPIKEPKEK